MKRPQLAGHVRSVDSRSIPRQMFYYTIDGKRLVGKPKRRWTEAVHYSRNMLDIRNGKVEVRDRQVWLSAGGQDPMSGRRAIEEEEEEWASCVVQREMFGLLGRYQP
jgi:hypothetical protein